MSKDAIKYVVDSVIDPALNSSNLDKKYKNKIKYLKRVINKIKKEGDLFLYLKRFEFDSGKNTELINEMKKRKLKTFEDIFYDFKEKYKYKIQDITLLDDFIIGESYNSFDIAIFAKIYSVQQGIYLIGDEPNYQAIFVKATLKNGDYPNEWIKENELLKYYMYAIKEKYDPNYKYNQAIINSEDIPIYVFIKTGTVCKLNGIFKYEKYVTEENGRKWFKLKRVNSIDVNQLMTQEEYNKELYEKVKKFSEIKNDSISEEKLIYDGNNNKKIKTIVTEYRRDPKIISKVLNRANGICEHCEKTAPFKRKSDGTPYLEVHHIIPLSEGGPDTISNTVALCPNCHARMHYGIISEMEE